LQSFLVATPPVIMKRRPSHLSVCQRMDGIGAKQNTESFLYNASVPNRGA